MHAAAAAGCRWTAEALQKYMKSARAEAPYLPSNIQYIANNNGLKDREDVSCCLPACCTLLETVHTMLVSSLPWYACLLASVFAVLLL
jgi:hypothetical protein